MALQYIVIGADQFGCSVARTLENSGCEVIVVDRDQEKIQDIADDVTMAYCADATDLNTLHSIGIKDVDGVVVSIVREMETSIIVCMHCLDLGIQNVIAQAKNEMHEKILKKIGVPKIVVSEIEMGKRIGNYLTGKNFSDWINISPDFSMVEVPVLSSWVGNSLINLDLRKRYGLNVICVRQGNEMYTNFDPNLPLRKDMKLFIVGKNEDLQKVQE
ncbi:MAG: TrkA family potassium uptake protein [Bacillota bacterium]|nr:TrkA family potassium uptake protein [Bacillota bacterium]